MSTFLEHFNCNLTKEYSKKNVLAMGTVVNLKFTSILSLQKQKCPSSSFSSARRHTEATWDIFKQLCISNHKTIVISTGSKDVKMQGRHYCVKWYWTTRALEVSKHFSSHWELGNSHFQNILYCVLYSFSIFRDTTVMKKRVSYRNDNSSWRTARNLHHRMPLGGVTYHWPGTREQKGKTARIRERN